MLYNTTLHQNNENENHPAEEQKNFFGNLFADSPGFLGISTKGGNSFNSKQFLLTDLDNILTFVAKNVNEGRDVYFSLGLQGDLLLNNKRGEAAGVIAIPGFWLDIDIVNTKAHAASNLPANYDEALELLSAIPFPPTLLVSSGYGLHVYWLFNRPWVFANGEEKRGAAKLLRDFQMLLRKEAQNKGWTLDNTTSFAQLLRVPYTLNYKDPENPRMVEILKSDNDCRYQPEEFREFIASHEPCAANEAPKNASQGTADEIVKNCAFIKACFEKSQELPEPAWYAAISNLCHTINGREAVHDMSQNYEKYSWDETEYKIEHAIEANAPHTCNYIQREIGFECPEGGCGSLVISPLSHANNRIVRALRKIKERKADIAGNPEKVFEPEILTNLAQIKLEAPEHYDSIKSDLKNKINLKTLNQKVKEAEKELKKDLRRRNAQDLASFDSIFTDVPLKNLSVPPNFIVNTNGIYSFDKDGELILVSLTPVIISGYMKNLDSDENKVELSILDGKWRKVLVNKNTISARGSIVTLPSRGLNVTSETAKFLVDYFQQFEMVNKNYIDKSTAASHLGWCENNFLPGCPGSLVLDLDDNSMQIARGFDATGSLNEWVKEISPLRAFPIARFLISASFASPLLALLKQRVFVIHSWADSRGGKTAATYAALSVWGDPEILRASFKDTAVAIERRAALFKNLPLVIDEKQVIETSKYDQLESLIYQISQGSSKGRGHRDGGFQPFSFWQNICISTGEEPISIGSSRAGVVNRIMEVHGAPIPNEDMARDVYRWSQIENGTAGPAFIQKLIHTVEKDGINSFLNLHKSFLRILEGTLPDENPQFLINIAVVMVGDFLSSIWIFDEDESVAEEEAVNLGITIAQRIYGEQLDDEATRAYNFIQSWCSSNIENFAHSCFSSRYGFIHQEGEGSEKTRYFCMYGHIFELAMGEGGFNAQRAKRDWADRGLLLYEEKTEKSKRRLTRRFTDENSRSILPFTCVKIEGDFIVEEGFINPKIEAPEPGVEREIPF